MGLQLRTKLIVVDVLSLR